MFDFFRELSDNFSQVVEIGNYMIHTVTDFVTTVADSEAFGLMQTTINALPAPIAGLTLTVIGFSIFDFVRGR